MAYKVLLVDDSAFARSMVAKRLEGTEFEVVGEASDGKEAVARYRTLAPNLVLMDVVMPDQGGAETLRQIMAIDPNARVLMISSLGTEDAVHECLSAGARSFLQKPFEKESLLNIMRSIAA